MQSVVASFSFMTTYQATISRPVPPPRAVVAPMRHQVATHSMQLDKIEMFKSLESWASQRVLPLLGDVDNCWQPNEFLPNPVQPNNDFEEEVRALRDRTSCLPNDLLVVLVGGMLTEDALPTYQSFFNTLDGVRDESGASKSPWATWTRAWTAEENRHGNLLRTYLYLSGRIDMMMVERTLQHLIGAGMDIGHENDPYLGYVYTSFQERATFLSHGNTARLAKESGDPILARICGTIAADEKRHEHAYTRIVEKLLEVDPNGAMLAIGNMMKKKITMPAHLMHDGQNPHLFEHFSAVAQRLGVYTTSDYANILEFLIKRWGLEKIEGLKGDGRDAQEYVCSLPPRIMKLHERADERAKKLILSGVKFSWIFDEEVTM